MMQRNRSPERTGRRFTKEFKVGAVASVLDGDHTTRSGGRAVASRVWEAPLLLRSVWQWE